MGCLHVSGNNPQALASGLSHLQVDNPWYNYYIPPRSSVDIAYYEIFHAKVGKGGI